MDRRTFLASLATVGGVAVVDPLHRRRMGYATEATFSLHPFLDAHPEAVFICRTALSSKTDAASKLDIGRRFAREVFTLSDSGTIPAGSRLALKPNLTCTGGAGDTVDGMGIRTDIDFLEGMVVGMTQTGAAPSSLYMREGNLVNDGYCPAEAAVSHLQELAARTGIHFMDFPTGRALTQLTFSSLVEGDEVIWRDVPSGAVFTRAGFLAPFNAPDSWIINIAKFKTHSMGMTLCVKNLQGTSVSPLVRYCEGVDATAAHPANVRAHFRADLEASIDALYARHRNLGYVRWDRPGRGASGGYGMETWAQRTCDAHTVMRPGLHIIEGLYGRNGNGFSAGPGPNDSAQDVMTNLLIFGRDPFRVDIIGTWLAGHEPGNFGLFHIAKERGLCDVLNPRDIPLYAWTDGAPVAARLEDFERTPLVCPYLRKDYNGGSEAEYHLVDEPFEYPAAVDEPTGAPETWVLGQNFANPVRTVTMIEYRIPRDARVLVEVFTSDGRRVAVLEDGFRTRGSHMVQWDASRHPSGVYRYRLSALGIHRERTLVVVH